MRTRQGSGDEILGEDSGHEEEDQGDYGMDGLAKSLGLNIEALAVKLAMVDDMPPTQTHTVSCDGQFKPNCLSMNTSPCAPLQPD